jgi:hypothetical protein
MNLNDFNLIELTETEKLDISGGNIFRRLGQAVGRAVAAVVNAIESITESSAQYSDEFTANAMRGH